MMERKLLNTKNVVLMGMFGALAAVLMLFEVAAAIFGTKLLWT